jgi:hypothetical protein
VTRSKDHRIVEHSALFGGRPRFTWNHLPLILSLILRQLIKCCGIQDTLHSCSHLLPSPLRIHFCRHMPLSLSSHVSLSLSILPLFFPSLSVCLSLPLSRSRSHGISISLLIHPHHAFLLSIPHSPPYPISYLSFQLFPFVFKIKQNSPHVPSHLRVSSSIVKMQEVAHTAPDISSKLIMIAISPHSQVTGIIETKIWQGEK